MTLTKKAHLLIAKPLTMRRFRFFLSMSLIGVLINTIAVDLPFVVPFLIGNVAFFIILFRLGLVWALLSMILVTLPLNSEIIWLGNSLQLLLLLPLTLKLTQPLWKITLAYALSISVIYRLFGYGIFYESLDLFAWAVILDTCIFLLCTRTALLLVDITSSPEIHKNQSLKLQLTHRIALYSAVPGTILIAMILQGIIGLHLSSQLNYYDKAQNAFVDNIHMHIDSYINEIEMLARLGQDHINKDTLKVMTELHPESISALMTDKHGDITHFYKAGFNAENIKQTSVSDRSYFFKPRELNTTYISEIFQGRTLGQDLLFAVSTPLYKDGQFDGVLEQSINIVSLTENLIHDDNALIADDAAINRILLDSESKKVWGSEQLGELGKEWSERTLLAPYIPPFYRQIFLNQPESIIFTADAQYIVIQKQLADLRWTAQYYLDLKPYAVRYFIYLAIAMVLVMLLMEYITILSTRFIRNYTNTLERIAQHAHQWDLDTPAYQSLQFEHSSIEFEMLSDSINEMQNKVLLSRKALMSSMKEIIVMNDELEEKVADRTKELEHERDKATQLAAIKTRFLANMSHEIRTPITIIKGFTEELLATTTGNTHTTLTRINTNTLHLQNVINDILDTAKIDEGQMEIALEHVLIKPFLTDIINNTAILAKQKNLNFDYTITVPDNASVHVDTFRLQQILLNLLSNAIKFTSQGTVSIKASLLHSKQLQISICDEGIGMSQIQQTQLFSPFNQGDTSISRDFGGTGLGLHITKKLADAMAIDLSFSSVLGQGSVFTLLIDANEVSLQSIEVTTASKQPTQIDITSLSGTLLIVDDVPDIRSLLASYLKKSQLELLFAENGQQALDMALANNPDVILMDQQMPIMDGLTAATQLRKHGFLSPIISLSADVFESNDVRKACPFNAKLTKPIDKMALLSVLSSLLSSQIATESGPISGAPIKEHDIEDIEAQEMRDDYLCSLLSIPTELQQIVNTFDNEALLALLHKIKGTSACLGLISLSEAATHAEESLKSGLTLEQVSAAFISALNNIQQAHNVA
ncbi:ATP-binding protein [Shewanella algicola]|uniref:ATP-binding protein n=1 Tax=Shewanella algicola TaxID=640633 RepID=UPI0024954FCB|nr:ATP-binding protein [Shewanella algicola]